jgi:hypothetical protein
LDAGARISVSVLTIGAAAAARLENGVDELVGYIRRQRLVRIDERLLAEGDRLPVALEIPCAVPTPSEMTLERLALGIRQPGVEKGSDELCKLAARHSGATSQKILIAPSGFSNLAKRSR